jgi:hypothetical protein
MSTPSRLLCAMAFSMSWLSVVLASARKGPGLPSWVADFSKLRQETCLQEINIRTSRHSTVSLLQPEYNVSGRDNRAFSPQSVRLSYASDSDSLPSLIFQATCTDQVTRVGSRGREQNLRRWLRELKELSEGIQDTTLTESDRLKIVWRTAAADQDRRQSREKPRLIERPLGKGPQGTAYRQFGQQKGQHCRRRYTEGKKCTSSAGISRIARFRLPASGTLPQQKTILYFQRLHWNRTGKYEVGRCGLCLIGVTSPIHLVKGKWGCNRLQFVGEAYVDGIMDGEDMLDRASIEEIALY